MNSTNETSVTMYYIYVITQFCYKIINLKEFEEWKKLQLSVANAAVPLQISSVFQATRLVQLCICLQKYLYCRPHKIKERSLCPLQCWGVVNTIVLIKISFVFVLLNICMPVFTKSDGCTSQCLCHLFYYPSFRSY